MKLVYIFLGGGLGSIFRYLLSTLNYSKFPLGTQMANCLSCLIVGIIGTLFLEKTINNPETKAFILIGFCGGFSTFSTFSNELLAFLKNEEWLNFLLYFSTTMILGVASILLGAYLTKNIFLKFMS